MFNPLELSQIYMYY